MDHDLTLSLRLAKRAFIPPPDAQQPGPDGQPVDPAAGAPIPVPGSAPAGGALPPGGDPAAGAAPADPSMDPAMAAGAPPVDPSAAPPVDPSADIMPDAPPEAPVDPNASVTKGQSDVVMAIVERTLTAVGKNKKTAPPAPGGSAAPAAPAGDPNALPPGPVTGLPGDMSAISKGGPLTLGG